MTDTPSVKSPQEIAAGIDLCTFIYMGDPSKNRNEDHVRADIAAAIEAYARELAAEVSTLSRRCGELEQVLRQARADLVVAIGNDVDLRRFQISEHATMKQIDAALSGKAGGT